MDVAKRALIAGPHGDGHAGDVTTDRRLAFSRAGTAWAIEEAAAAADRHRRLCERLDELAARNDALERRIVSIERTLVYHLASRLWTARRRVFPDGSRRWPFYRSLRRLLARLLGAGDADPMPEGAPAAPPSASEAPAGPDSRAGLAHFEAAVRATGGHRVAMIASATQLLESEGQRPTQLALALSRRGIPVVFVYWRWWHTEWRPQDRLEDGILQVPIDVVIREPSMLTAAFAGLERLAFFEFPLPDFFETLAAANAAGWITVYDVLDHWEEFQRVGQAVWYDEPFERHLVTACDATFAVNETLASRIRELGGPGVEVVGNGVTPGLEVVRAPRPLARGEITVGYFGYLSGAWFDWSLIAAAARRRPSWRFYLIGYGGSPDGFDLPATVHVLGKQPQTDLAAYAANWDVAVIPFKPGRLAASADPIKTYEYLAMGLPVVTTGVMPPTGAGEHVAWADGVGGFVREIERAARRRQPAAAAARRAYAAACTWDQRLETMLTSLAGGGQRVPEKRALFEAVP